MTRPSEFVRSIAVHSIDASYWARDARGFVRVLALPVELIAIFLRTVVVLILCFPLDIVGWLFFATLVALMTSCASNAALHDARAKCDAAFEDVKVHAANLPSTTLAKCELAQQSIDELDDEVQVKSTALVTAAESGNVAALVAQVAIGLVGLGTTYFLAKSHAVAQVNEMRDASSPARTASDLKTLAAVAANVVTLNPQPKEVIS